MSDEPIVPSEAGQDVPVPDYEIDQYLPGEGGLSAAHRRLLRAEFGRVRTFFKTRPKRYWKLQRWLNQGRFGLTYDLYLTRVATLAIAAWFVGAILGVLMTVALTSSGALAGLSAPFSSPISAPADVVGVVAANRTLFVGSTLALVGGFTLAAVTWLTAMYYPYVVVDARRRNIDIMLPHAIVYMYALSFGGMDFAEVLRRMAKTEETYGEVAHEFDAIVRDIEVFGSDLFTALRNTRNLTPSDNFEELLDDMLSVLDSGGNMTTFLENEGEKYMEQAADEQETFLETLATLSEVFIVAFVAAPLFLIVTLLMMGFLGASTIGSLSLLVYVLIPLGMAGFLVVVALISSPYDPPRHRLDVDDEALTPSEEARQHPMFTDFVVVRLRKRVGGVLRDPLSVFKRYPLAAAALSVPAGLLAGGFLLASGPAELTQTSVYERPVATATAAVAVPFVVSSLPVSAFYEYRRRRRRQVAKRFPDALNLLASANQMGVRLSEGFDLLARNYTGHFARELQQVRNDIRWNHDVRRAVLGLAGRLDVPQVTRSCKILAEGSRSTGDLHRVLAIAAEDTRHRFRLDKARRRELSTYSVIVIMGFLVYLGVVVIIDKSFLQPVVERAAATSRTVGPITISADDLSVYQALFLHSALVQAVGTGLITGKLADNDLLSGLKYSIALILVALGVFTVL